MYGSIRSFFIQLLPENNHLNEQNNSVNTFSNPELNYPKLILTSIDGAHDYTKCQVANTNNNVKKAEDDSGPRVFC